MDNRFIFLYCDISELWGHRDQNRTRESKDRDKQGRSLVGKTAKQSEAVIWSEIISSEVGEGAVKKSRYCVYRTRTVNRHRWVRRES